MITQKRLKEVLHYNSRTGIFHWLESGRGRNSDLVAGTLKPKGYVVIHIDHKFYLAHRLAWLYVYGKLPKGQIDHKDTIKTHNWIKNLRDVTHAGNQQNRVKARKDSKTGVLGVHEQNERFIAHLNVNGKSVLNKSFETSELAHAAYLAAKRKYHPTCTI